MKKLLFLFALFPLFCFAAANDSCIDKRNATNTQTTCPWIPVPASDAIYYYDLATFTPKLATFGTGFTVSSGVITLNFPVTSVNGGTGAVVLDATDVGAANALHDHVITDITGLVTELNDRVLATDTRLSDARVPLAHNQSADTITNGTSNKVFTASEQTKLAGITAGATLNSSDTQLRDRLTHTGQQPLSTISDAGTAASLNVAASGDASTVQVVKGNDTRLTNARTPTAHQHNWSTDITGKCTTVSGCGITDAATVTQVNAKLTIPTGTTGQYLNGLGAPVNFPTIQAIQRLRVQTDASGNYTWTYPTAYPSGVVPVISAVSESASSTVPQGVQIVGVPTNTSATFKVINLPSTSVLGIVVLGAPTAAQAYIHITAVAP